jgi:CheY-like chemotaxis protein
MSNEALLLLVEDEPLILMTTQEDLEEAGFTVVTASSGAAAIAALEAHHSRLAGLITDIRLGDGPDGWEIARHARGLSPDMPVVYLTGDGATDCSLDVVPMSIVLSKPVLPAQLLSGISGLLGDKGA